MSRWMGAVFLLHQPIVIFIILIVSESKLLLIQHHNKSLQQSSFCVMGQFYEQIYNCHQELSISNSNPVTFKFGSWLILSNMSLNFWRGFAARFLRVCIRLIKTSRLLAPSSACEPKLTFRAITAGRSSRSARLFSQGTALFSTQ